MYINKSKYIKTNWNKLTKVVIKMRRLIKKSAYHKELISILNKTADDIHKQANRLENEDIIHYIDEFTDKDREEYKKLTENDIGDDIYYNITQLREIASNLQTIASDISNYSYPNAR